MRAISLWEPWATAIAKGLKTIETRGWQTAYRGPLAIHAAKTRRSVECVLQDGSPIGPFLADVGITDADQLHFGRIVATCYLADCAPTEWWLAHGRLSEKEKAFGNFSPGRFGWILTRITPLATPVEFRGHQGFFNVPDELLSSSVTSCSKLP